MKAVLVGADLMYRKDGSLAPIEINTNTGWDIANRVEPAESIYDLSDFVQYVQDHDIKNVYVEKSIISEIKRAFSRSSELKAVANVFVSTVEEYDKLDNAESSIFIRGSYSDEALVDSFCRDKIAFLRSLENTDLVCEYLLKTADGFEGNITSVETEYPAGIPNFILKYRYPNYDKSEYPKLLRFESIEDLLDFAESDEMPEDFFLMPYYFCEDELWDNERIKLVRNISLFVANSENSLDNVEIGKYTKVCGKLDLENLEYSELGELDPTYRSIFLSTDWYVKSSRKEAALLDKGDLVWMADGSWKKIEDLKVGEYVKSLEIPAKEGYDVKRHVGNYGISVEELEQETHYVDNEVISIGTLSRFDDIVKFSFTDGTDWYDTAKSSYPTVNAEEQVEFKTLNSLKAGDKVILISLEESETPKFLVKELASIESERRLLDEGYTLVLNGSHLFISRTQGEEQAYAAIEHNEFHFELATTFELPFLFGDWGVHSSVPPDFGSVNVYDIGPAFDARIDDGEIIVAGNCLDFGYDQYGNTYLLVNLMDITSAPGSYPETTHTMSYNGWYEQMLQDCANSHIPADVDEDECYIVSIDDVGDPIEPRAGSWTHTNVNSSGDLWPSGWTSQGFYQNRVENMGRSYDFWVEGPPQGSGGGTQNSVNLNILDKHYYAMVPFGIGYYTSRK